VLVQSRKTGLLPPSPVFGGSELIAKVFSFLNLIPTSLTLYQSIHDLYWYDNTMHLTNTIVMKHGLLYETIGRKSILIIINDRTPSLARRVVNLTCNPNSHSLPTRLSYAVHLRVSCSCFSFGGCPFHPRSLGFRLILVTCILHPELSVLSTDPAKFPSNN